jgi:hypothetical protein
MFFLFFSFGRIKRKRALEELDSSNLLALIIVFVPLFWCLESRKSQFNFKSSPSGTLNAMFIRESSREPDLLRWRVRGLNLMSTASSLNVFFLRGQFAHERDQVSGEAFYVGRTESNVT